MLSSLRNMFRVADLRNKILFTLAIIALYRLGSYVPAPGIDLEAFDPAGVPGNGLWLLTADAAAEEVVAAVGVAGSVHYTAAFTELTPGTPETVTLTVAVPGPTGL